MKLTKRKKQVITKLSTIGKTLTMFAIQSNICFAESIGTAEVETATENIKRVLILADIVVQSCCSLILLNLLYFETFY